MKEKYIAGVTTQPLHGYDKPSLGSITTTFTGVVQIADTADTSESTAQPDPLNGYEYVDLGLPSGTLWATMNVGANSPEETGLYFLWGDTLGYTADQVGNKSTDKYFGWEDYKYGNGTSSPGASGMTKYNASDGLVTLSYSDDAATANMGGFWRMPTEAEINELLNSSYCTNTNTTINGVDGRLFTSKANGNTLFFPFASFCGSGKVYENGLGSGRYWTSSLNTGVRQPIVTARYMAIVGGIPADAYYDRNVGMLVRGVVDSIEVFDDMA